MIFQSTAKRVAGEPRFEIKNYRFVDLAMMYYPDRDYDSALRLFRREMHETRGMWKAMLEVGYKEHTRVLTRAQVKVIVKYLAPPIRMDIIAKRNGYSPYP